MPCYMWMTFEIVKMIRLEIISIVCLCMICAAANAEVFKCITADGHTKYQSSPCAAQEKSKKVTLKGEAAKAAAAHKKAALDQCQHDIVGLWQLTHTSTLLDNNLVEDKSQNWAFQQDGYAQQQGADKLKLKFICKGTTITLEGLQKTPQKQTLKIVRLVESDLVLRSVENGGYLYLQKN